MKSQILEIVEKIRSGATTARAEVEAALQRARADDKHALLEILEDSALKRADEIDMRIAAGENVGRLAGVPYVAKDNFLTSVGRTTAAAKILENFESPLNATAIERLDAEGAILIGKANLDAFAHGGSTENSAYGATKNAADDTRVAGGSSGGSAVAVATGIVPFALGSDTGGSIRQPASFNGVVGYKPTYGMISRYGVVAMASSTDVVGPIASSVADVELLSDILAGRDDRDSTVLPDYFSANTEAATSGKSGNNLGKTKPIIAVDIDDVCASFVPAFIDFSNKHFGTNLTPDDYEEYWLDLWKIDDINELRRRRNLFFNSGTYLKLKVVKGARETLSKLAENYELKVVTSRPDELLDQTAIWLDKNFPNIFSDVHHLGLYHNKEILKKSVKEMRAQNKAEFCRQLGAEYLIDDQPKHINAAAECGTRGILFGDYSWNRHEEVAENVFRAKTWADVGRFFDSITKEQVALPQSNSEKLKIGLIREFMDEGVDNVVKNTTLEAVDKLRQLGHVVADVSLPMVKYALPIYYIVVPAELSSNLARYDGIRYGRRAPEAKTLAEVYGKSRDEGFVDENKRRIMIGAFVLSSGYFDAYYLQAQKARTLLIREFDKLFKQYDFLIGPVSPTPAFKLGENTDDPIKMYLADIMTVPASLAGLPAISLPNGTDENGLPIGLQIIGPQKSDAQLLNFAKEIENA